MSRDRLWMDPLSFLLTCDHSISMAIACVLRHANSSSVTEGIRFINYWLCWLGLVPPARWEWALNVGTGPLRTRPTGFYIN